MGTTQAKTNAIEYKLCWMRLGYIFGDNSIAESNCLSLWEINEDMAPTIGRMSAAFYVALIKLNAARDGRKKW